MPITIIENIDHTTMSYPRKYSVDSHYEVRGWSKLEQFQERTPRRKWRGRASSPNLDHVYQFILAECIIWRSIHRGDNCIIHIGYITLLRWPWKKSRMIGSIWKKFIVEETLTNEKNGYSEVTWGQCLGGNVFTLSTYDHNKLEVYCQWYVVEHIECTWPKLRVVLWKFLMFLKWVDVASIPFL